MSERILCERYQKLIKKCIKIKQKIKSLIKFLEHKKGHKYTKNVDNNFA